MKEWRANIPYRIKIFQIEYLGGKAYDLGSMMRVNIPYGILLFLIEYFWWAENP